MQILLKQYSTCLFLEFTMKKISWYIFLSYSCEWDMTDSTQMAYLFFQFSPENGQALKITTYKVKYIFFNILRLKENYKIRITLMTFNSFSFIVQCNKCFINS